MTRSALGPVFASFQLALGFVVTRLPDWASTTFVSENGKLWYVLRSELKYDVIAVSLLVIFAPQVIYVLRYFCQSVVQMCFVAPHLLMRGRIALLVLTIACCFGSAFLFGLFVHSVVTYAAVIYNELNNYEEISRQRLINEANAVELTYGRVAAIPIYKRVLSIFADDPRNSKIEENILHAKDQDAASKRLTARAITLQNEKKDILAIEAYRMALAIFPHNADARKAIASYQGRLSADRAKVDSFFEQCKQMNLRFIIENIDSFWFSVRDMGSIKTLTRALQLGGEPGQRVYFQICNDALKRNGPSEYFASVEHALFKRPLNAVEESDGE
jgi:tetratricopeptide (TPR) repeat protein